jgi:hypothetical protein
MRNTVKQLKQLKQLIRESIKQVLLEEEYEQWSDDWEKIVYDELMDQYRPNKTEDIIRLIDSNNLNPKDVVDYIVNDNEEIFQNYPKIRDIAVEIAKEKKVDIEGPEDYSVLDDDEFMSRYQDEQDYESQKQIEKAERKRELQAYLMKKKGQS